MAQKSNNIFALLSDEEEAPPAKQPKNQRAAAPKVKPNVPEPRVVAKESHEKPKPAKEPAVQDRKSRTGRNNEMKKGGAGAHNWGAAKQFESEDPATEEAPQQAPKEEEGEPKPEVNFITMSEWLGLGTEEDEEETKPEKNDLLRFRVEAASEGRARGRGGRRGGRRGEGGRRGGEGGRRGGEGGRRGGDGGRRGEEQPRANKQPPPNPLDPQLFPALS